MSRNYEKLKTLLEELFQLDQPDLDFGFYRVMHVKSAEIREFLDKELLPQVEEAVAQYRPADRAALEKELAEAVAQAEKLGADPETLPKVKELRARLAEDAVDLEALEAEVYDHLYSFFRRYYSEGDFLSKRVYKPGVYAIPYEGELVIRFEYRPATVEDWPEAERQGKKRPPAQKDLNAAAEAAVLGLAEPALADWIQVLGKKYVRADGTLSDNTRLRVHLDRYTARNTFDYFIHKDLGGFLRRELDFYIKNEVMHLDDIESESVPRVEQYLSKIKVIRRIAHKIIDFLAQLEDFQKKLWLKKKFVTETSWCVRLGVIPEEFFPEIVANEAQRQEWEQLGFLERGSGEGSDEVREPGPGKGLRPGWLFAEDDGLVALSPTLRVPSSAMIDTRHFDSGFTARLLAALGDLDGQTDGVLFHSENFQALSLMQERYREQVKCIYIDPPYNTGNDGFAYKDNYQHSSWLTALLNRFDAAHDLLSVEDGSLFSSIDDGEQDNLRKALAVSFGDANFIANIIWQKKYAPANDATWLSDDHDFLVLFARSKSAWSPGRLPRDPSQDKAYKNPDNDPRGPWKAGDYKCNKTAEERPNLYYPIIHPKTGEEIWPNRNAVWRYTQEQHERNMAEGRVWWGADGSNRVPAYKRFLSEVGDLVPRTIWKYDEVGHNQDGIRQLRALLPDTRFTSPKPVGLIERVVRVGNGRTTLDYFAGSGTTGHAVINLNREDGGRRKFILVEQGDYFDTVLLPRLKKVTFSPEWKDGRPKRPATAEEAERGPRIFKVVRLESYEDTLNNLELKRASALQGVFDWAEARGPDRFREQYVLRYMLEVETRGSQSLLNVAAFTDPTAYTLKVKRPGSDESREVKVDLIETFNWLIGLTVEHMAAPQTLAARFERDDEGRLRLKGRLKQEASGPWWFRTVTGATRDGRKVLVIWRNRPGGEDPEGVEQDNLVLDEWFRKQGYSSKDSEFDLIYVNGDNNLENLKAPDDTWKVRLIEEDFLRLMFATEDG